MADQKVSDLPSLNGVDVDPADLLYVVDSSAGTAGSKKITVGQYQLTPYSAATTNAVTYFNGSKVLTGSSALTFDGSNLGIGTSSPGYRLHVVGSATESGIFRTTGAINALYLADSGTTAGSLYIGTVGNNFRVVTGSNETMRLDSSGNLGLGTATPSGRLNIVGGSLADSVTGLSIAADISTGRLVTDASSGRISSLNSYYDSQTLELSQGSTPGYVSGVVIAARNATSTAPDSVTFWTRSTERARITSEGDFGINGTPSADSQFYSKNDGANKFAGTFENHSASGWGVSIGTASTVLAHFYPNASRTGGPVGSITTNGTSTSYVTSSDRRLKDNIVPAPSASDDIDAIQIVSHDWKSAPDEHVKYGVIAQDLHAVAPEAVTPGDDGDEIEKTWGVDYSKLVPMLIKEIQSLRARVAALEAQ